MTGSRSGAGSRGWSLGGSRRAGEKIEKGVAMLDAAYEFGFYEES